MKLTKVGSNMTELKLGGGLTMLFSYETPVACIWANGKEGLCAYRTEQKWSVTTTKHITKWLGLHPEVFGAAYKPQEYFDNLVKGA